VATPIPIRNLYYLYAYAWDQFKFVKRVETGSDLGPDAASFFSKVLVEGCRQLFRRGVDRTYRTYEEERSQLRGRISIATTYRHNSLRRAKVWCEFDELQFDSLQNQLIKATLIKLSTHKELATGRPEHRALLQDIRKTTQTFDALGVTTVRPEKRLFHRIQLHRNNAFYRFLLHVCELALASMFPDHDDTGGSFASVLDNEQAMSDLFERFVRNFYRREQTVYNVASEQIRWTLTGANVSQLHLLPMMLTDISLRSDDRTIIIDTKYYSQTLAVKRDTKKLHSANLFQIFAYLKNLEARPGPDARADGILLYPTVSDVVDFRAPIQGHVIRAKTIDLRQPWESIRENLLLVLEN
jgi:5-methylcytosine-specific restriction enzyme subunit McrC